MAASSSAISRYGVMDRQLNDKERWLCFAALFLYGFITSFNLFKASSVLTYIAADLGIASGDIGLVITSFSIAGLLLAYPGAMIMRTIGIKSSVMIVVCISLLGTILGSFSQNAGIFMVSRAIEGVSYGLFSVMGPNIMPRLFPLKKQGLVMGAWSLWMPVGSITAFVVTPFMFEAFGWRSVWYAGIVLQIIAAIMLFLFLKMPAVPENEIVDGDVTRKRYVGKNYMFAAIMMSVAFTIWSYIYLSNINGLYPTFLQEVKGLSIFESSLLPTVLAAVTVAFGVFAGILSDKLNSRKWFAVGAYLVCSLLMFFFAFTEGDDMVGPWIFVFFMGLCGSCIPMATRSIIPVLAPDPKKTDYALATMAFVTCVAQVFGVVASRSVEALGWNGNAVFVLGPAALVGALIVLICVKSDRKVMKENAERQKAMEEKGELSEEVLKGTV